MSQENSYHKWVVLVVLFLILMFGFGGMNIIAPLSLEIDKDIGLTLTQLGAPMTLRISIKRLPIPNQEKWSSRCS